MKYLPLVWAALRRKPTRTLLTCLSIVTAFFLFGTLEGVNVGIDNVVKLTSVSHLIVQSRVNQGAAMPLAHKTQIQSVPGVTAVAPFTVVIGTYKLPTTPLIVIATDCDAMLKISTDLMVAPEVVLVSG